MHGLQLTKLTTSLMDAWYFTSRMDMYKTQPIQKMQAYGMTSEIHTTPTHQLASSIAQTAFLAAIIGN